MFTKHIALITIYSENFLSVHYTPIIEWFPFLSNLKGFEHLLIPKFLFHLSILFNSGHLVIISKIP